MKKYYYQTLENNYFRSHFFGEKSDKLAIERARRFVGILRLYRIPEGKGEVEGILLYENKNRVALSQFLQQQSGG